MSSNSSVAYKNHTALQHIATLRTVLFDISSRIYHAAQVPLCRAVELLAVPVKFSRKAKAKAPSSTEASTGSCTVESNYQLAYLQKELSLLPHGSLTLSTPLSPPVSIALELVVWGDGRREPALLQLQAVAFRLLRFFFSRGKEEEKAGGQAAEEAGGRGFKGKAARGAR